MKKKPQAIDLFSGCGGLTLGLKRAGFRVRAAIEIDKKAKETYEINHPDVAMYAVCIREVDPKALLETLGLRAGELDLLAGCPPCQGFSRLRTRNRSTSVDDERNDLIGEFERFCHVIKPKSVMLENVPSLRSDGRFARFMAGLSKMGYEITTDVLNTADYGVPQRRKRLIMLASIAKSPRIAPKHSGRVTVRDAFRSLSSSPTLSDPLTQLGENRSLSVRKIIELIPKDGGSRSDLPEKFQLPCHRRCKGFGDVYGRMAWDDVSPTITSGCHNPSKGRFLHPSEDRTITLREAATLQGFPHDYRFNVVHGKEAIALMIGNALPPPFIEAHAKSLLGL
jgi:DNA (cytosine-5)-methyltransferase 1